MGGEKDKECERPPLPSQPAAGQSRGLGCRSETLRITELKQQPREGKKEGSQVDSDGLMEKQFRNQVLEHLEVGTGEGRS